MLVGLANELFIAGHETTASTLTWTLFLLERHPRVLQNLLDELSAVLHGGAPTIAQLDQLPLLDAVVKESMRLLSATPFLFFRQAAEGVQLGSYDLPSGSKVVISPLMTHREPALYAEPTRFMPERWQSLQPTAYEYLPFGAGPRMCLGAAFANVSLRVMLSLIVQRYRFESPDGASVSYRVRGVILGSKDGVRMHVANQSRDSHRPKPVRGNIHELVTLA
jgi:cytochrome P450